MRKIDLTEYRQSGAHTLSIPERDALSSALPSLAIAPVSGTADSYHLTPGSTSAQSRSAVCPCASSPR